MPPMNKLRNPDLSNMRQVPAPTPAPTPTPTSSPTQDADPNGRAPNMLSSMPLMASTGDAFQRQFYGGTNVPTYRILPAKRGAGA
jgi:hypothetical protein